jgi:hypothetical protein
MPHSFARELFGGDRHRFWEVLRPPALSMVKPGRCVLTVLFRGHKKYFLVGGIPTLLKNDGLRQLG